MASPSAPRLHALPPYTRGWFQVGWSDQLKPGQVSGIIQDQLGFDIVKVLERDSARDLSPELLQYQRQQAFLAWLDAQRNKAKIEKLANP